MLIATFLLSPAGYAQSIKPSLDLTAVRVEVTWTDAAGIRAARERYARPAGSIREAASIGTAERHRGFAVLGKRKGQDVCLLFVEKPKGVDDERTLALGHELLHCLLGNYHP